MSLDSSPKAKAVYEQSSKILFKQKWGMPKAYSFSPFAFLAGPNLPHFKVRNNIDRLAKSQKVSKNYILRNIN